MPCLANTSGERRGVAWRYQYFDQVTGCPLAGSTDAKAVEMKLHVSKESRSRLVGNVLKLRSMS